MKSKSFFVSIVLCLAITVIAQNNPGPNPGGSPSINPATNPTTNPAAAGRGARRGGRGGGGRGGANNPVLDSFYHLGPDSLPQDGVPKGKIIGPTTLPSQVYPGTGHTYWVYVPAQYDPSKPTALMIYNDGQAFLRPSDLRANNVMDNLIWRREIPPMIAVFIDPGKKPEDIEPPDPVTGDWGDRWTNRPVEYNSVNDKYARVICDELMPVITKEYNINPDPDFHGIAGASSGAIAAFDVAWYRPDMFHKVFTIVGSFVDLSGQHGSTFPDLVAAADKKPIRIFVCDGVNDNRNAQLTRDWHYQNVRLVDALTKKGYDVNYSFGIGLHGQKQGGLIMPEMTRWLWRDYPRDFLQENMAERSLNGPATKP
jgi:enterochelin esterase family protein